MRSVNRARTGRKKLIALMSVCELKDQPCLTNSEINHTLRTEELLRALRGKVYGWRGGSKATSKFCLCTRQMK